MLKKLKTCSVLMPPGKKVFVINVTRTEWSPIPSLTIPMIDTSIITDRIRRHEVLLYLSKKKKIINSTKYETTTRAHYALCPFTHTWLGNRPFNCPIMKSNYKHDAYTDLSVLKSGWWEPVTFKNFVIRLINSGNRTAWSPIRSVISNHSYNYRQNWTTRRSDTN